MGKVLLCIVWHFLERVLHVFMHNIIDSLLIKPLKEWVFGHASLVIGLVLLAGAVWGVLEPNRPKKQNPPMC